MSNGNYTRLTASYSSTIRSDRELHGKCMISEKAQAEIKKLQKLNPNKSIMLVAEKGTMGVGSSRMSGVNNVALLTGKNYKKTKKV